MYKTKIALLIFFAAHGTLFALSATEVNNAEVNAQLAKLHEQVALKKRKANILRQEESTCRAVAEMPDVITEEREKALLRLQQLPEEIALTEGEANSLQSEVDRLLKIRKEVLNVEKPNDIVPLFDNHGNPSGYELHLGGQDPQAQS